MVTAGQDEETGQQPLTGMMALESRIRTVLYLKNGCNAFSFGHPISWPMAFWAEEDVWGYIKKYNLKYSSIYDKGERTTGCMFCMFGVNRETEPNRFQRMAKTHPKIWDYCINNLGLKVPLEYMGVPYQR